MNSTTLIPSEYYIVIDFEATCDRKGFPRREMEIIEFAGQLVDRYFRPVASFFRFVKPTLHPVLSKFCSELTTIQQEDVDEADTFPKVLQEFVDFIKPYDPVFVSWGDYDRNQLRQDCRLHRVGYPFNGDHINIKKATARKLGVKPKGIGSMLRYLNMKFIGTPHRGIDDVQNIVRIMRKTLIV